MIARKVQGGQGRSRVVIWESWWLPGSCRVGSGWLQGGFGGCRVVVG